MKFKGKQKSIDVILHILNRDKRMNCTSHENEMPKIVAFKNAALPISSTLPSLVASIVIKSISSSNTYHTE